MPTKSFFDLLCEAHNSRISGMFRPIPYETQRQPDVINARAAELEPQMRAQHGHLGEAAIEREVLIALSLEFGNLA